ncbi:hypothetical protein QBC34DRAFT_101059 [Podospora aff. communis PSN243]|uniref:DUF2293 domain-containing protein n=1 Tax=Podospora aff. communis PSN243 TaxID=3040156 RepID=A0AAV9GLX8_9PEZI|nr:hypothetical protein QBC34DRAFT_101059 [Podospora aff. communis PSN243]
MVDPDEPQVAPFAPMPKGYQFVRKGDVYITRSCRVKTHQAGQTLYVVVNKNKKVTGLRCPKRIYDEVLEESKATAAKRAEAVAKRDNAISDKFEETLLHLFPACPKDKIPQILKHALEKRSGRVGRTSTVELEEKVKLAVRAHIRHCHTPYDALLRSGVGRKKARQQVIQRINEVVMEWGFSKITKVTKKEKTEKESKGTKRKVEGTPGKSPRKVVPVPGKKGVAKRLFTMSTSTASVGGPQKSAASTSHVSVGSGLRVVTRQMRRGSARNGRGTVEDPFEILDSDMEDVFSMSEDSASEWSDWSDYSGDAIE